MIPFLGGVICALLAPHWLTHPNYSAGISGLLSATTVVVIVAFKISYKFRWMTGLLIGLSLFSAGVTTVICTKPQRPTSHEPASTRQLLVAEITEPPRQSTRTIRLIVKTFRFDSIRRSLTEDGKKLLFLPRTDQSLSLSYGDWILFSSWLNPIRGASNPYAFDPAAYYHRKGVFSQAWVDSTQWEPALGRNRYSVRRFAFNLRSKLLNILRENQIKGDEFAVASALLLGYVNEIDKELRKDYASSGAMHILAVSGMHVGIIFLFLEFSLSFLNRRKQGPWIKAVLMILVIWGYALITGLSPSVFRAAIMLSFVIAGRTTRRKPETLNVVAAAMLIMLISEPRLLLNIGFQFSYLAVFGILFLYKPLVNLLPVSAWFPAKIWALVSVSIAAQLATFPLALHAFHQFPNYFILTNILVVPLASLIIYAGIGVLSVSAVPWLSLLVATGLSFLVRLLNTAIRFVEGLPGSTTTGIYISGLDTLFLYMLIIFVIGFLKARNIRFLYLCLTLFIFFSVKSTFHEYSRQDRIQVAIFQVKGSSLYDFVMGERDVCMKDYRAVMSGKYALEIVNRFRLAEGIRKQRTTYLAGKSFEIEAEERDFGFLVRKGSFIQFMNRRIGIISESLPTGFSDTLKLDLVILRGNPKISINEIIKVFSPNQIVIDASNSWYNSKNWKEQAVEVGITCYSVVEEGAVMLDAVASAADLRRIFSQRQ